MRKPGTGRRVVSAVTLAAAVLAPAAPAQAGAAPAATRLAGNVPCQVGAVTATDREIAAQLRPSMTGPRLGSAISGDSIACARAIVAAVQARGLGPRAAVIAMTTAIAESTLRNSTVATDHDSVGLFQQRPSQGWGRVEQLVNPKYATDAFLTSMLRFYPGDRWMTADIGTVCQTVQRSAHPAAYGREAHDAGLIVSRLWYQQPASAPAGDAPAPAQPKPQPKPSATTAPTGPYQKPLVVAATQLGPLDGRHELALADWNGDKHPDLMVVKGEGTATGKTEVRIMDGATGFSALLVTATTALGATDDRHAYAVTDWNGDGRPDLMVVQKAGTTSGRTDVTVLDGASSFRQILVETSTAVPGTDDRFQFAATDWNSDGRPDLLIAQTSGTVSNRMEIQVLDGASGFQKHLVPVTATPESVSTADRVLVADFNDDRRPDPVVIRKAGTADGRTRVRVLDGANPRRSLQTADTAPGATAHLDMLITQWNDDKRPDLMMVQKTGTLSGRSELVVLGG
ncbi:FG-GAP repeat domain-containing protein [Actinoplanes utahensis]|uniref:T-cell immunomodulatory-like protein n=1 Tax=Actinoplanes utahensis TaxID=1869 RepID=A0A0A6X9V0_ACTUT|nr:VCBS repeat-containing protein [Actinoplanes utahensis]KHD76862.1 T-cell immunomodulatory-like protein [Actinoplanes utahensis]